ncbi:glycodelin [Gracilinanus agilis]|uniref:glycodelin n=1 Tax=Gracilinanus agilis TaxID=191870 RepID=UPI001CFDD7EC|nr:glycodelin [Gracilinanus agilis]
MKFLLLTVGLALIGTIQAIENIYPQKDVVVEELSGRWYLKQLVSTMDFPRNLLEIDIKDVSLTPEGDLELVIARRTDNCVEKKILAKKTEKPAVFEIAVPSEHDLHTLTMVKTDYDNFTLVCLNMDSLEKKACAYYVRRIDEHKGMEEFKKILLTFPMPYTVTDFIPQDMCRF